MPRKKKAAAAAEQQVEAPATMADVVQELKDKLGAEVIESPAPPAEGAPTYDATDLYYIYRDRALAAMKA